jgi:hypothetical protein
MEIETICRLKNIFVAIDTDPDLSCLKRETLIGPILDKICLDTNQLISERLTKNGNPVSLMVSCQFDSTIFAFSSSLQNSSFIELEQTTKLSTLAEQITQYLQRFPQCIGLCLEKYPTKQGFFNEIRISHPSHLLYGCTLHGFDLLIQDLFSGSSQSHPLHYLNSILYD